MHTLETGPSRKRPAAGPALRLKSGGLHESPSSHSLREIMGQSPVVNSVFPVWSKHGPSPHRKKKICNMLRRSVTPSGESLNQVPTCSQKARRECGNCAHFPVVGMEAWRGSISNPSSQSPEVESRAVNSSVAESNLHAIL